MAANRSFRQPGLETSSTPCYPRDPRRVIYSPSEPRLFVCEMRADCPFLSGYGEDGIRFESHGVHSAVAGAWTALNRRDSNSGLPLLLLILMTCRWLSVGHKSTERPSNVRYFHTGVSSVIVSLLPSAKILQQLKSE